MDQENVFVKVRIITKMWLLLLRYFGRGWNPTESNDESDQCPYTKGPSCTELDSTMEGRFSNPGLLFIITHLVNQRSAYKTTEKESEDAEQFVIS